MPIVTEQPGPDDLAATIGVLAAWQADGASVQLHPGDVGWFERLGRAATVAALRTWRRDGRVLAVGLQDEPTLVRLALAPEARADEGLAHRLVADLSDPGRGVLTQEQGGLEAPAGALVRDLLTAAGWREDQPWTPLRRDLSDPVDAVDLQVEVVGPGQVPARTAVQRAAFDRSTFTDERWALMAAGPAYADARCLLARDADGEAVAAVTVWSAGPGRPGLLEPMGVHRDHRDRGHGRAVTLAAAAHLRDLGASSAVVCTPSSNVGGIATYVCAGFEAQPPVPDLVR